ncbi:hypothetical protein ACGFIV_31465 [Sphaerisporangium sp. NPDC049003]|uniref:hypothetical protein n=1 Tax=Sphaerisporangium sp. NPDC049003 TaxID=3364517 RepID=UPI00371151BE
MVEAFDLLGEGPRLLGQLPGEHPHRVVHPLAGSTTLTTPDPADSSKIGVRSG